MPHNYISSPASRLLGRAPGTPTAGSAKEQALLAELESKKQATKRAQLQRKAAHEEAVAAAERKAALRKRAQATEQAASIHHEECQQDWSESHRRLPPSEALRSNAERKRLVDASKAHRKIGKQMTAMQAEIDAEVAAFAESMRKKKKAAERMEAAAYRAKVEREAEEERAEAKRLRNQMETEISECASRLSPPAAQRAAAAHSRATHRRADPIEIRLFNRMRARTSSYQREIASAARSAAHGRRPDNAVRPTGRVVATAPTISFRMPTRGYD